MRVEQKKAASVRYENITYAYGSRDETAIDGVDFGVDAGKLVVLVGPSGCGKSTLLKITAGLLTPQRGRLLIDGEDALKYPPEKRKVGWVPQSYALFEHLTIADNVGFGLKMLHIPKSERAQIIGDLLRLCRIEKLADRSVAALSGGQRQRVAIARALAISPRVLLLDEPLAALDPQLRIAIREDLVRMLRESKVTTLFVTHDQSEALALADEVVVLRDGRVEQRGSPNQLWHYPVNEFVAEFVGNATIVSATPVGRGKVKIDDGLECSVSGELNSEAAVRVALRSEDIVMSKEGVDVQVAYSEYKGGKYHCKGCTANGTTIPFSASDEIPVGTTVCVTPQPNATVPVIGI